MPRKVTRSKTTEAEDEGAVPFGRTTYEYVKARRMREDAQKQEDNYKKLLMGELERRGDLTDNGHRQHTLIQPIDGGPKMGTIVGIRRTRREQKNLNEERAMALIEKNDRLREKAMVKIEVLSEEGILAANFEGIISDKELEALYDTKETFAFDPIKEK